MNIIRYKTWKYLWLHPQDKCPKVELLGQETGVLKLLIQNRLTPAQKTAGKGGFQESQVDRCQNRNPAQPQSQPLCKTIPWTPIPPEHFGDTQVCILGITFRLFGLEDSKPALEQVKAVPTRIGTPVHDSGVLTTVYQF